MSRGVDQYTAALAADHSQRSPKLHATIASKRAESISRETFRVDPRKHRVPVIDLARDECKMHKTMRRVEGVEVECSKSGRQSGSRYLC
jgi:hypothetical protein